MTLPLEVILIGLVITVCQILLFLLMYLLLNKKITHSSASRCNLQEKHAEILDAVSNSIIDLKKEFDDADKKCSSDLKTLSDHLLVLESNMNLVKTNVNNDNFLNL